MRKLVVGTFLTLDGVMQAPGGTDEDRSGDFPHGGWMTPYYDEMSARIMVEWIQRGGGLLLGRKTYEIFAGYWPHHEDNLIGQKFNASPKYVASRTLNHLDWEHSTLLKGDVAQEVRRLKSEPGGELQVHGSGELIQTLLRNDLIDEFRIWTFPVLLGSGKRLFQDGTVPSGLKLLETQTTSKGAVLQVYQTAGKPTYGEFAEPPKASSGRRSS